MTQHRLAASEQRLKIKGVLLRARQSGPTTAPGDLGEHTLTRVTARPPGCYVPSGRMDRKEEEDLDQFPSIATFLILEYPPFLTKSIHEKVSLED